MIVAQPSFLQPTEASVLDSPFGFSDFRCSGVSVRTTTTENPKAFSGCDWIRRRIAS